MQVETKQEQVAQHAHVGARLRLLSRHLELHDAHPMQREESHRAAQRLRLEALDVNLEHAERLLHHGVDAHGGDRLPIGERAWRECGDVIDEGGNQRLIRGSSEAHACLARVRRRP